MAEMFQSILWENWLNGILNWSQFTDYIPSKMLEQNGKWNKNQPWILQDPNKFYYPLFGLGDQQSDIMFVGIGPGHNIEPPWSFCNNTAGCRSAVTGPYKSDWCWMGADTPDSDSVGQKWYHSNYSDQKATWESRRLGNDKASLYDDIGNIMTKAGFEEPLSNSIYYTNFMKDGEFEGCRELEDTHLPMPDNLTSTRWEDWDEPEVTHTIYEVASREFWLPLLAAEIANVDPEVIVPFGDTAAESLCHLHECYSDTQLFGRHKEFLHPIDVPNTTRTIIPSLHLSGRFKANLGYKDSDHLNKKISNKEEYLEHLAIKITRTIR
jgi:hypothetical protein